jgi:hypothetical protein
VPLSPSNFFAELNTIRQIATSNGYTVELVDNLLMTKQKKQLLKRVYNGGSVTQHSQKWAVLPFVRILSSFTRNLLPSKDLKCISVNKLNLGTILVNNKDPKDKLEKSGV